MAESVPDLVTRLCITLATCHAPSNKNDAAFQLARLRKSCFETLLQGTHQQQLCQQREAAGGEALYGDVLLATALLNRRYTHVHP
jgi:hypothetical protein